MEFYLVVRNNNKYEAINFRKSKYFKYLEGDDSLRALDRFTTQFNSEEELKQVLFKEGLLSEKLYFRKLDIMNGYKSRGNFYLNSSYGVLYSDSKEYKYTFELKNALLKRSDDAEFLKRFGNQFYNNYENLNIIDSFRSMVRIFYDYGMKKTGENGLDDIYSKLIDSLFYNNKGELKYSNVHLMLHSMSSYDKKQKEEKPKMRTKEIEGQYSLFD